MFNTRIEVLAAQYLFLFVRNATDLSKTVLDEKIGLVSYEVLQNTTGATTKISAGSNILSFDGAGGFSAPVNARARDEITRTPSGISFLNDIQSSAITGTYSVTSDGALSMTENAGNPRQGFVTSAGDLLVAVQVMSSQTNYRQVYSLGVKLGATPPSLSGAKYALYPMEIAYRADDTEILTFAHPSMLTFNAAGSQATLAGKSFGITRGSDLDQVMAPIDDKKTLQMTVNVSPDSTTNIVSNDGSTVLAFEGFVAADASRMVLKLKETKALGTSEAYYGLGFGFWVLGLQLKLINTP